MESQTLKTHELQARLDSFSYVSQPHEHFSDTVLACKVDEDLTLTVAETWRFSKELDRWVKM